MKILLIQSKNLIGGMGGAEKMCCFYANIFAEAGHDIEIATMEDVEGNKPQFHLDSRVKVKNLFSNEIKQLELKPVERYKGKNLIKWIYKKYKKEIAKFYNRGIYKKLGGIDSITENIYNYNLRNRSKAWSGYINSSSPDIVLVNSLENLLEITFEVLSIHGRPDYDYTDFLWKRPRFLLDSLRNTYRFAQGCNVLLSNYKDFLPKTFSGKAFVIPNPVDQIDSNDAVEHSNGKDRLVVVNIGRLDNNHKQQSKAIEVFSKLANKYPKWDLHFWGIGEDELMLREKIAKLGLSDRIFLKGFTDNLIEKLKESDIFVFPSKYEGFPLALTEAMGVGLPSVGFEYCSGVNELIEHDKNGFLAKDETEMQEYLERLMCDSNLRNKLGKQANKDMEKYSPDIVAEKWNKLINEIVEK